jgi:pimeloyl-ACP methyl ester carboxylesterase
MRWVLSLKMLRILLILSLLACSACTWLDVQQRQLIYRPTPSLPTDFTGLRAGDEHYFITVAHTGPTPQRVELWWLPHADPSAPTLLYFHGTFRTLAENQHKLEALREAGFAVLGLDYRGWGVSTPITPSEQTILQDAEVAWAELQRREPRAAQRVIYGHSMGSGVAVDLASRLHAPADYGALILESAFTSFPDVAREAGLVARLLSWFNHERFDSLDKIARVQAPLLMIHGDLDTTIPLPLGAKLFAAANPPKQWLTIEGGAHSDLDQVGHAQYQATLQRFRCDYLAACPSRAW